MKESNVKIMKSIENRKWRNGMAASMKKAYHGMAWLINENGGVININGINQYQ